MEYVALGKSDLKVSRLGFGCMSLKGTHAENAALLQQALHGGINFFDTADLYDHGENEVSVGKAFKACRDQVIISSKVGNEWRADSSGWDWNPSKAYILKAVEKSLERLQTSYIDLYQLHGGTLEDNIDEVIEAFELLKKQGKIRYYGISSIRPNVIRQYVKRSDLVSVMMQYSWLDRRPEEQALGLLQENNIGVLVRGSLAQGLLAGKPLKNYLSFSEQEVAVRVETVRAAALLEGISLESLALQYVLSAPAVTTAVLGIRTSGQLNEALAAVISPPIPDKSLDLLRQSFRPNVYEQHR